MRKFLLLALAALAVVSVPVAFAATRYEAKLSGAAERPKSDSKATGEATFTLSSTGKSIKYRIEAKGLTGGVQAAHIHAGKTGQAGGVIFNICTKPCKLPKSGTLTSKNFAKAPGVSSFSSAIKKFKAGQTYVNLHTKDHAAGEIRGQIRRNK
jgi:hypothetical protein